MRNLRHLETEWEIRANRNVELGGGGASYLHMSHRTRSWSRVKRYPEGMAHPLRTGGPSDSIKYPKVYRGLRKHGYPKAAAARISNAGPEAWRRGGRNSHRGARSSFSALVDAGRANQAKRQAAVRKQTVPKAK